MKDLIIAIDGHSGCGKSTTAKRVAEELGYVFIDTGAMYRAVTLYFLDQDIDLEDTLSVAKGLHSLKISFEFNPERKLSETYLNGVNVEKEIRSLRVSNNVSKVAAIPDVRHALVNQQRKMGEQGGVVMDGRDIGTNVFPNADIKIFVTADVKVRAERRLAEMKSKGEEASLEDVIENLQERDRIDSSREESPLKKADDAYVLDTTSHTIDSQTEEVLSLCRKELLVRE